MPQNRNAKTSVLILLHGGGWVHGDKSQFYTKYAEGLFENNWIIANMNYRLVSEKINCQNILEEVNQALNFLKNNSEKYGILKNKFVLVGYSAGGHIALLYTYKADTLNEIELVVSQAGPTNINDPEFKNVLDSAWASPYIYPFLLGEEFSLNSKAAIDCSPVYHIKSVPTILMQGTADEVVPYKHSFQLNDSLNAKNIKHLLISIPNGKHQMETEYLDSLNRTIKRWLEII